MEIVHADDVLDRDNEGVLRCLWGAAPAVYRRYHDKEWGRPVIDDARLFEKVSLEGFQAGLSWLTILRKRDAFRAAFAGFDLDVVSRFGPADVRRLVSDVRIVRHRGKIESTVNNARRACDLRDEVGSLARYFWRFEPDPATRPSRVTREWLGSVPHTPESASLSKDLKQRGWTFVGPTTIYAFMQAVGLVNDHQDACSVRSSVERARQQLARPG